MTDTNIHTVRLSHLYEDLDESIRLLKKDPASILKSRNIVEMAMNKGDAYYGINTGFGVLANKRIEPDQLQQLQRNLILSHSVGVGDPIPKDITRLMLKLKIHALGLGYSGISLPTFERLLFFVEHDLIPVVPSKGSLGASGDLAPLAHMCLPLIGFGSFWDESGTDTVPAEKILDKYKLTPIELKPKDGLSLINGTQMMSAYGTKILYDTFQLARMADIMAAMSLEALQGSIKPFDARIHEIRPHKGAQEVAQNIRSLLTDSEILESHRNCGKVQDPYCLRCVPQVHGASRDALRHVRSVLETEINSVTDNPLVFPNGDIISGGNFHGQPLALAFDYAAIALAEFASISERRIYLLLEGHDGLPKLLMHETGINSGFMLPQYTAAALVSENKILTHPASVDTIPTSLGQEDHVSMGSIGALKLNSVCHNVEQVLAIELFTASQALDYREPLRPGRGVEVAHQYLRSVIPHTEADYYFNDDITRCLGLIRGSELIHHVEEEAGRLI